MKRIKKKHIRKIRSHNTNTVFDKINHRKLEKLHFYPFAAKFYRFLLKYYWDVGVPAKVGNDMLEPYNI